MIKKNINKILSFSFMFGLLGISSYAKDIKTDNTPPVISYTEERIGDREKLRVTVTATDESGIREFRDHEGNTIVGNTTTVEFNRRGNSTFTAIDNAGNESSITIDLSWINPYTSDKDDIYEARKNNGATYWSSSSIREWLNSESLNVSYTNNPPTDENTGGKGYSDEPGFLSEFTQSEIDAIAVSAHRVWTLSNLDPKAIVGGTGNPGHFNSTMPITLSANSEQVLNYKKYAYSTSLDKVYLLSPYELYWYIERRNFETRRESTLKAQEKHNIGSGYKDWQLLGGTIGGLNSELSYRATSRGIIGFSSYMNISTGIVPVVNIKPDYIFNNGKVATELKIGDTVEFGRYLGDKISWIVINISDNNYPMLISEKILDFKVFDALGDESRLYSDYINYSKEDVNYIEELQYKSTKEMVDVDIPTGRVLNESDLNLRHNTGFILNLEFFDNDSGIDYIIKPDGSITTETKFSYFVNENKDYIFGIMDNAGNFNKFGIPIGNINQESNLIIELESSDWLNRGASIHIGSDNSAKQTINCVTSGKCVGDTFPNYISYSNSKFKVKGLATIKYFNAELYGEKFYLDLGFKYDARGSNNSYTYTAEPVFNYSLTRIPLDDIFINKEIYFEEEVIVPENYFRDLYPVVQVAMPSNFPNSIRVEFKDVEFLIEDDSDFHITNIVLPNGDNIEDVKNYTDIIEEEGIHNLTYKVLDSRGITTEKTVTVKVDKTSPVLNLEYNYDKFDFLSNKSLVVNISGSDALSGFKRIKLPNGNYTSSSNTTYTITNYGTHVFECEDVAGNITRETIIVEDMSAFEDAELLVNTAEQTRNSKDISIARESTNNLVESSKKDELQDRLNAITDISDITFDKKSATSNIDIYIKSENMLLMSLSTNNITFENYSGVDDMELNNAVNISINSSLPYQLNSYLLSEIENSDKSSRIEKDLLNIKSNIDNNYKTFNDINEKLILEDDCDAGNNKSHSIDLKLKGSQAHKADIYKTVIKFEAEQK